MKSALALGLLVLVWTVAACRGKVAEEGRGVGVDGGEKGSGPAPESAVTRRICAVGQPTTSSNTLTDVYAMKDRELGGRFLGVTLDADAEYYCMDFRPDEGKAYFAIPAPESFVEASIRPGADESYTVTIGSRARIVRFYRTRSGLVNVVNVHFDDSKPLARFRGDDHEQDGLRNMGRKKQDLCACHKQKLAQVAWIRKNKDNPNTGEPPLRIPPRKP